MPHKILYLGLDPTRFRPDGELVHYPIIRIEPRPLDPEVLHLWPQFTHVLFTSRQAALLCKSLDLSGKILLAIGNATAEKVGHCLIAKEATQEGMMTLIASLPCQNGFFFWPRSSRARSNLSEFLTQNGIRFLACDLYRTVPNIIDSPPDPSLFDEIVFTSPSCVEAYLQIYGPLPKNKRLRAIGPITSRWIKKTLFSNNH